MQSLYHTEATFSDPVFHHLKSAEVKAMWKMLLSSSKDLRVKFHPPRQEGNFIYCRWEAWYTFSKTNRPVHNIIDASIEVRDQKIFEHKDAFDFWRWSRQALGLSGTLLGWTPLLKNKVRQTAAESLRRFIQREMPAR